MSKIIPMPKRASGEPRVLVPRKGDSEHIVRYPRFRRGQLFADFMRDKRITPKVYYCVIQRDGSNDIISWSQHLSYEAALMNARAELTLLLGSSAAEA